MGRKAQLGHVGLIALLASSGCGVSPFQPEYGLADFDVVWEEVGGRYAHFALKGIDWPVVRSQLRPRMEQASSGDEVERVMSDLLAALRDPHVWLEGSGGRFNPYLSHRTERDEGSFDLDIARSRMVGGVQTAADDRVTYGVLTDNLGYIYIRNFRDGAVDPGVEQALASLRETDGLVIDVRGNQGGSQAEITRVVGRFTSESFDGLPTFVLGKPVATPTVVPRGAVPYTKPTVVLIDGTCFSACESFAEMLMSLASVRSLGDTTAGAGGGFSEDAPGIIQMPSGALAGVPTAELRRYDGTPMEWSGVPPDVRIPQARSDAEQGVDRQLDAAVGLISGT